MEKAVYFTKLFVYFLRNTVGCINKPYITYRKLAEDKTDGLQTIYIMFMVLGYFTFASLLRAGIRNPYLLTFKFNSLTLAFISGFLLSIAIFILMGKVLRGETKIRQVFVLWSYSLLPTVIWFFATSILYIVLPPPRTFSILGKISSIVFISFSIGLLFWKVILYYLTLRFGLRFDLKRIFYTTAIFLPVISLYTLITYKMGIFRIPFI
jgi:hypothetical protein